MFGKVKLGKYIIYKVISHQYNSIIMQVSWYLNHQVWFTRGLLYIIRERCFVIDAHVVEHSSCCNDGATTIKLQYPTQGCTLMAPGHLRRPTFVLRRLKKNTGRPVRHPALLLAVQHCSKASD